MRRLASIAGLLVLVWTGCILDSTYDYSKYGGQGSTSGGAGGSSSSSSSSEVASSSSSGDAGAGGMMMVCTKAEQCNNNVDDNCDGVGECNVVASWANRFGDDAKQVVLGMDMTVIGATAIAGGFEKSLVLGGKVLVNSTAFQQPFLATFDPAGVPGIVYKIDTNGTANGVTTQGFNSYITGKFVYPMAASNGEVFIQNVMTNGAMGWERRFGTHILNQGIAIGTTQVMGAPIFVTGIMSGMLDFGMTCPNYVPIMAQKDAPNTFLLKLSPNYGTGQCLWAKTISNASVTAMTVTANKVIIVGTYDKTLGWAETLPLAPPANGTASFVGEYTYTATTTTFQWAKFIVPDPSGEVKFQSVTVDAMGTVYAAGTLKGTVTIGTKMLMSGNSGADTDAIVAAFDGNNFATPLWAVRFGGTGSQIPTSLLAMSGSTGEELYVSGTTGKHMAIDDGMDSGPLCDKPNCGFLLKLRPLDGTTAWARAFGENDNAPDANLLLKADNTRLWLGGSWAGDISFDGNNLQKVGMELNLDVVMAILQRGSLPN